ncbi:putative mandelate racemase/muconate lactonizing family protein [Escherichia coli]|uniref:Putative mandelate racemase/muconate lactonizing family protein n=1 Tax=Escherichia coli TaxID=562 RepID=A0A376RL30_ECOLX|nr:putative mandelate racemase/muconate lactonizing family protein [Escherichia coli]
MANSASTLWQAGAKLLKVKLDNHLISERMVAIRTAVPDATLIVDANESWRAEGLAARCQLLADLGVAMLEQPFLRRTMRRRRILFIRCRFVLMRVVIHVAI